MNINETLTNAQNNFFIYNVIGQLKRTLVAICSEDTYCNEELICSNTQFKTTFASTTVNGITSCAQQIDYKEYEIETATTNGIRSTKIYGKEVMN